jgi:hypothetical protein
VPVRLVESFLFLLVPDKMLFHLHQILQVLLLLEILHHHQNHHQLK